MRGQSVVLMLSIADWDAVLWTNKQHTARALRDVGYTVFYVDSMGMRQPSVASRTDLLRLARRAKQMFSRPRLVEPGIVVWSPPAIPMPQSWIARRINMVVVSSLLRLWLRRLNLKPLITWTYHPLTLALLRLGPWGGTVYHCVDDFASQAKLDASVMESQEAKLVEKADAIFVTSRALQEKFSGIDNVYYYPNSVDVAHFQQALAIASGDVLSSIPRPRVGFVGAIAAYKMDALLLLDIFRRRAGWQLILVGPREDDDKVISELLALPNITHINAVSFEEVPHYMASLDVGIIPAVQSPYTRSMFPMKFFEYLASGIPVVSTELPSLNEYRRAAKIVARDRFEEALASTIDGAVEEEVHRGSAFEGNSYKARTKKMVLDLRQLGLLP